MNRRERTSALLAASGAALALLARPASSAPTAPVYLSDLVPTKAVSGWGPIEKDQSNGERAQGDGHTLSIAGTKYAKGIGCHALSDIRYRLGGGFTTFLSDVGVDDEVGRNGSIVFQVFADGTKLYESGILRGGMAARHVSVDVTRKNELELVVTDAGDGIVCDHADWADARLVAGPPCVYVSDLAPTLAVSGWGPIERDMSNGERAAGDGHTLSIAGAKYAKGLGVHALSDVRFDLAGGYTTFVSDVGVDDEVGTNGSIVFQVWADGVELFASGVLRGGMKAVPVSVDVTGKKELRLVVTDAGDGITCDHADWAGARLLGGAAPPALVDPADVPLTPGTPSLGAARGADKPEGSYVPALYSALTVRASRNETVDVILRAQLAQPDTIQVAWQGAAPSGVTVTLSDLPVVWTSQRSEPQLATGAHLDPVVPKTDARVAPSATLGGTWLLAEIATSATTPPGLYSAVLKLAGAACTINLRVWPMTLAADQEALPSYWILDEWANVQQHFHGSAPDLGTRLALQAKYARCERVHRMTLIDSTVVGGELPIVNVGGVPQLDCGFTSYDSIVLDNRPQNAMIAIPWERNAEPSTKTAYLEAIENTIAARGWQDRAFIYLTDEPDRSKYPTIVRWSQEVKAIAPHLKIMVTTVADPSLVPYVDIFVVLIDQVDTPGFPTPADYQQLTAQGKKLWIYVSCDSHGCGGSSQTPWPDLMLDDPAAHVRSLGWQCSKYGAEGFLYYYTNLYYYYGDPWNGEWAFGGNGDGTLLYPGRPGEHGFTDDEPVASLRIALARDGLRRRVPRAYPGEGDSARDRRGARCDGRELALVVVELPGLSEAPRRDRSVPRDALNGAPLSPSSARPRARAARRGGASRRPRERA